MRTLLFRLTASDFEVQTFCTGGNGGQHRNAKRNGVRIIHPASGARAEHRDGRDQNRNRTAAFEKLCQTPAFRAWHAIRCSELSGATERAASIVEASMRPEHIRVETFNGNGWDLAP